MPLLDSFRVDHTIMPAPAVRVAKTMKSPSGDVITVFDLRFCVPNEKMLGERGIHTLEHLFAGFIREHLNSDTVEIKSAYIHPEFQKKGIGSDLFNRIIGQIKYTEFKFYSVDNGCISAQAFRRNNIGEPQIVLKNHWRKSCQSAWWKS